MQQRYYDAEIGRFISPDPMKPDANTGGNFNVYWYADNNPVANVDPDGRLSKNNAPTGNTCSRAGGTSCSGAYAGGGVGNAGIYTNNVSAFTRTTSKDEANLDNYADPTKIAEIVDAGIKKADFTQWLLGKSGQSVDQDHRYVFTKIAGWIDLQHVASSASNPVAQTPFGSIALGFVVEILQKINYPLSAGQSEDYTSNTLGSMSAVGSIGSNVSRGALTQAIVNKLEPLTQSQAYEYFHVKEK